MNTKVSDLEEERARAAGSISFAEAEKRSPRIKSFGEEVRRALREPSVWKKAEQYLYGTAVTGSVQFNHGNIAREIRDWDRAHNEGRISAFGMTDKAIWNVVSNSLKRTGFQLSHGVIVGLLEHGEKPSSDDEDGGDDAQ